MVSRSTEKIVNQLIERAQDMRKQAGELQNHAHDEPFESVTSQKARDARDFVIRVSEVDITMARLLIDVDRERE